MAAIELEVNAGLSGICEFGYVAFWGFSVLMTDGVMEGPVINTLVVPCSREVDTAAANIAWGVLIVEHCLLSDIAYHAITAPQRSQQGPWSSVTIDEHHATDLF